MNQKQAENLINNWYKKANEDNDTFSKFVFLWFCIEIWITYKSPGKNQRESVNNLKLGNIQEIKTAYNESKRSIDLEISKLVNECPIFNDTRPGEKVNIVDNNDFENIVEAIYTIRNNLFHAKKDPDDESRDKPLILLAGNILNSWIDNLINSWYFRDKISIAKKILEDVAKGKNWIHYGDLYPKIGLNTENIIDRNQGSSILAKINDETLKENGIMLSSLVVLKKEGEEPAEGFYDYAIINKKLKDNATDKEKMAFWIEEMNKCHSFYN
jgi:hypothetical protein